MNKGTFITLYNQIKTTGSLEESVSCFWQTLLPRYFPSEDFMIGCEQRPGRNNLGRMDLVVSTPDQNHQQKTVVFVVESKRREFAGRTAEWTAALEQLTEYLQNVRTSRRGQGHRIFHAAIAIGTYVRFYQLNPSMDTVEDLPSRDTGKAYELQKDEMEIHEILTYLASASAQ